MSQKSVFEYPYLRDWCIDSLEINRYNALQENWTKSKKLISDIRCCAEESAVSKLVLAIASAGSIGRMEASPDVSDADLIIILKDGLNPESDEAKEAYRSVWDALKPLKLASPKGTGLFAKPTNKSQLIDSIGNTDEKLDIFGKRLLLLLETQPVYGDENYRTHLESYPFAKRLSIKRMKQRWIFVLA